MNFTTLTLKNGRISGCEDALNNDALELLMFCLF